METVIHNPWVGKTTSSIWNDDEDFKICFEDGSHWAIPDINDWDIEVVGGLPSNVSYRVLEQFDVTYTSNHEEVGKNVIHIKLKGLPLITVIVTQSKHCVLDHHTRNDMLRAETFHPW